MCGRKTSRVLQQYSVPGLHEIGKERLIWRVIKAIQIAKFCGLLNVEEKMVEGKGEI